MSGIGREFMRKTQFQFMGQSAQVRGVPEPPAELPVDSSQRSIKLPAPKSLKTRALNFRELVEQRRSVRDYTQAALTLAELSYLLWCTQGVQQSGPGWTIRTVPSAGARHAFETLVLANRIEGVAPGLWRYHASAHQLVLEQAGAQLATLIRDACADQSTLSDCAATFIWLAVAERMTWRYHERGYRYLHLDAGHVCQNLYLAAETIDCGVCAIAAFDDERLNQVLKVDGKEVFAIYLATLGKKAAN